MTNFRILHILYSYAKKYQTHLCLLELSHQMGNVDFWLFTHFWLFLHDGNIKLFCTSKNQNKNNSVFLCLQISSNLGKFLEINKQFHVKSWLTYQIYSSVWWILSCTYRVSRQLVLTFDFNSWLFWLPYQKNLICNFNPNGLT